MNERKSYFFIYYVEGSKYIRYYEPTLHRAEEETVHINFKHKKEDIMVYTAEGSKAQHYLVIPESSPYFNLPRLVSKANNTSVGKSLFQHVDPVVRQLVDKVIK